MKLKDIEHVFFPRIPPLMYVVFGVIAVIYSIYLIVEGERYSETIDTTTTRILGSCMFVYGIILFYIYKRRE